MYRKLVKKDKIERISESAQDETITNQSIVIFYVEIGVQKFGFRDSFPHCASSALTVGVMILTHCDHSANQNSLRAKPHFFEIGSRLCNLQAGVRFCKKLFTQLPSYLYTVLRSPLSAVKNLLQISSHQSISIRFDGYSGC